MKQIIILIFVSAFLMQFTCGKTKGEGGPLEEINWHLAEYTFQKQKHIPIGKEDITLRLEGNQLNGHGGCNRYFGSYSIAGVTLSISSIGATEMACPVVMQQEQNFFYLLENARAYTSINSTLTIFSKKGQLVFKSGP